MKGKVLFAIVFVAVAAITCKHEIPNRNPEPVTTSASCDPDSVYFTNSILPLISSTCALAGCHDAITAEEELVLTSYAGIMRLVQPGNPNGSKLVEVITKTDPGDVMPPPPHPPYSTENINLIKKWISQGAKNNNCASACDTTVFSYSGAVVPIINLHCKGCHNPASLGGGIDLSTYSGVTTVAATGRLLGSIKFAPGYKPMPQGAAKLSDCKIRQIEKWIQAGMPQN